MSDFETLRSQVIDQELCTRCGSCIGVCPQKAVYLRDPLGECIPDLHGNAEEVCVDCSAPCLSGCPGQDVDFPILNEHVFGEQPSDYLIGHTIRHHIGYAANSDIRRRGSSGGIITGILDFLLREGRIDGVLTLVDQPDKPLQPVPVIVRDTTELMKAAQSKYSVAPVNTILNEVESCPGRYAYVGLPCQIHSIRKLQRLGNKAANGLSLLIGSYCGSIQHFTAIKDFLLKFGVRDLSLVQRIQYRAGEWPGHLLINLTDGREFHLEKFYANYMTMFYTVKRCQVCSDISNELADISAADAWAPEYEERGKGYSLIVTRTSQGEAVVNECISQGVLISEQEVSREKVISMHCHMIDNKKIGAWIRSVLWKGLGRCIPEYHLRIEGVPLRRVLMGLIVGLAFEVGETKSARWFIRQLPLGLTGRAFKWFRSKWKSMAQTPAYRFFPNGSQDE